QRHRQRRRQAAGVADLAAGDDQAHAATLAPAPDRSNGGLARAPLDSAGRSAYDRAWCLADGRQLAVADGGGPPRSHVLARGRAAGCASRQLVWAAALAPRPHLAPLNRY